MKGHCFKYRHIFNVELFEEEKKDLTFVKATPPKNLENGNVAIHVPDEIWEDAR